MDIIVALIASIIFSLIASRAGRRDGSFSYNTFMGCLAICIAIMVWIPIIPSYTIIGSICLIMAILFSDRIGGNSG